MITFARSRKFRENSGKDSSKKVHLEGHDILIHSGKKISSTIWNSQKIV